MYITYTCIAVYYTTNEIGLLIISHLCKNTETLAYFRLGYSQNVLKLLPFSKIYLEKMSSLALLHRRFCYTLSSCNVAHWWNVKRIETGISEQRSAVRRGDMNKPVAQHLKEYSHYLWDFWMLWYWTSPFGRDIVVKHISRETLFPKGLSQDIEYGICFFPQTCLVASP